MHVSVQVCHPPPPACGVGKEGQVSKLETVKPSCVTNTPWGGGGLLGLIFAGYVLLASQNPYPTIVYSAAIMIIDLILVTLGKK